MSSFTITRSQIAAAALLPAILPLLAILFPVVVALQGRPFLFASERMRDPETPFRLYKIRTMRPATGAGETVLGGPARARVTPIGRVLRRTRLDELPQIFNVLRGDIGFIGPRPPLRTHVQACPRRYGRVLNAARPGITGLSTVLVHHREERLLARCRTAAEAERLYREHCLPLKLRLDMIYAERRGPALDLFILWRTFSGLLPRQTAPCAQPEATCQEPSAPPVESVPLAA